MTQPDLFVVCKNCGSEVSPYVTECPYCGQRVRKRAPRIERGEDAEPRVKERRRRRPSLPRLRAGEIEGIAPETRPYATLALIVLSLAVSVALAGGLGVDDAGGVFVPDFDEAWRYVTAPFVHDNLGYQFAALLGVGVFGMLLERRFGPVPVVLIFLLAGAAGVAAAVALDAPVVFEGSEDELFAALVGQPVLGANGAALGLLTAWLVDDRLAKRRGDDRENDLVGVLVFAAVLLLLPLATAEANVVAGVAGVGAGAVLGALLGLVRRG